MSSSALFFILLIISTTISWFRFYPRNEGQQSSAIQVLLAMLLLVFFYSGSLTQLGYLLLNTDIWKQKYTTDFGLVPGWLSASAYILHMLGGLGILISTLIMARYQNRGRVWVMRLIPIVAITMGFVLYWEHGRVHGIENTQNTILIFIMISALVHAGIFLFFDSVRIRKYFNAL